MVKSALAIHDLSGFGRCALTVVIPVLSAFGIQTIPVPTAVLSTHTGGFQDFSFVDMTAFMKDALRHYKDLNLQFDCIYSGFLGNEGQAEITIEYLTAFGNNCLKVVDPAFADDGKLYSTINPAMIDGMKKLITYADVITPNFTEAAFLLGVDAKEEMSLSKAEEYVRKLSDFGPDFSVITGVPVSADKIVTIGYNKLENKITVCSSERINESYPGCGDLFASCLCGFLLEGTSFEKALSGSVDFINSAIRLAQDEDNPVRNGLPFEKLLKNLNFENFRY